MALLVLIHVFYKYILELIKSFINQMEIYASHHFQNLFRSLFSFPPFTICKQ